MLRLACPEAMIPRPSLVERLEDIVALGFQAVELDSPSVVGREAEVATEVARRGLAVSAIWETKIKGSWGGDARLRYESRRRLEGVLRFAADTAADGVVIIDHQMPPTFSATDREQALDRLAEFVQPVADFAASVGTVLLIEPLERDSNPLFATVEDMVAFCDRIDSRGLRICADTYHMRANGEDLLATLRQARDYIGHVHFSDFNPRSKRNRRPLPGAGKIDFAPVAALLEEMDYFGYVAVEGSMSKTEDYVESFRKCVQYLRSLEVAK